MDGCVGFSAAERKRDPEKNDTSFYMWQSDEINFFPNVSTSFRSISTTPTLSHVLVPETLLKKRKTHDKAAAAKRVADVAARKVIISSFLFSLNKQQSRFQIESSVDTIFCIMMKSYTAFRG